MSYQSTLGGFFDDTDWGDVFNTGVQIYTAATGGSPAAAPGAALPGDLAPGEVRRVAQSSSAPLLLIGAGVLLFLVMKGKKGRR